MRVMRLCRNCGGPRQWKKIRPEGARQSRFECIDCGSPTRRIKGQRKKATMPPALYDQSLLVKEADRLWRQVIYMKASRYIEGPQGAMGECPRCFKFTNLQAMHVFSRSILRTRHDLDNGIPGCAGCHMYLTRHPDLHSAFCEAYLGPSVYEQLNYRAHLRARAKLDLKMTILYLRRMLGAEREAAT